MSAALRGMLATESHKGLRIELALLVMLTLVLTLGFWPGVKGLNAFRGMRNFWLFIATGYVLAIEVGRINMPLGLLMGWGTTIAIFDVMAARQVYSIVSGDFIWPIAISSTFLIAYRANRWKWLAVAMGIVLLINIYVATNQVAGLERNFRPTQIDNAIMGVLDNQPNFAHFLAISLPLIAGLFGYLAFFGVLFIPLKSSIAALSGAVGLSVWKPKVVIPIALIVMAFVLLNDPMNLSPKADGERLEVWKRVVSMTAKEPFLQMGHGIGSFKRQFPPISYRENITPGELWFHPQNELVRLFYEVGLLGPVLALLAVLSTLFRAFKSKVARPLLGAFAAVLVSALGYEVAMMPQLVAPAAMIWGLTEGNIHLRGKEYE